MIDNINWYPGHMKKTKSLIADNLKAVDAVAEVIDSRIPISSRNPIIGDMTKSKVRILLMNKWDLADENESRKWMNRFSQEGYSVLHINAQAGEGIKPLFQLLEKLDKERTGRRANLPFRLMVVGIPNVGKSSLINRMTGRKSTQTGDRPGVTKGKQWLTLPGGVQLLDTPGILWPKFEDPMVGLNLAFCGSIRDEIMDIAELGLEAISMLQNYYPELLMARYKLDQLLETPLENMEAIAAARGFVMRGNKIDYERTARTVLDEFRSGQIGRITLERSTL